MKNLIENKYLECEKELKININLSVEDVMFIKGKMEAYMSILESLKDYNLITAPKKPIYENDLVDENIVVDTWAFCPTCKEEIPYELWENLIYCPNCGQKLDWSDTNE